MGFHNKDLIASAVLYWLSGILFGTIHADERFGVLYPEEQQRQIAVQEAAKLGVSGKSNLLSVVDPDLRGQLPITETPSKLEALAQEKLASINFEDQVLEQSFLSELEQFGYSMFSGIPTTYAPSESIPVPEDYQVAPGDSFILQIFGAADLLYSLKVTREGRLLVPEVGDLQVAGLTFSETKQLVQREIENSRIGARTLLTLESLHSIQVLLVGEVAQPGTYTVSGLSTLVNTLISTGGILRSGSLRSITVRRGGRLHAELDLYDLLLGGQVDGDIFLKHGDVIFIPPLGDTISIAGEVKRPAIYELKSEENVSDIVSMAGGVLPTAALNKVQIERVTSSNSYGLFEVDLTGETALSPIKNGDLIKVYPVINRMKNVVLLAGSTLTPGGYQWSPGMRVSNLVGGLVNLPQSTDLKMGLIDREDQNQKKSVPLYFSIGDALTNPGSQLDPVLLPRDRITLFDVNGNRTQQMETLLTKLEQQTLQRELPPIVSINGHVQHPGKYPLAENSRFLDVIERAGGIAVGTDRGYSLLVRTDSATREIEFIKLSIAEALVDRGGDHNPLIKRGDGIHIFDFISDRSGRLTSDLEKLKAQTKFGELTPVIEVSGKIKHPGKYPLTPGMRVRDLIVAAGGMTEDAYGLSVTLSRQSRIGGEATKTKTLYVSLSEPNSLLRGADTILEPYDHLVLRQKPNWVSVPKKVSISGEVVYPGTYEVDKNETLCGVIRKVGGFTDDAYLFGSVFIRESVRQREQVALDRINRQLDDLLADVHISPGFSKDTKLPMHQGTTDTFQVIQQLTPEKAVGRMVVDIRRAAVDCDEKFDIVLENNDSLYVPKQINEVSVVGQVYFPTSHQYRSDRAALDYINLSGGTKELAQREHVYIVQANGEVMTVRSSMSSWGSLLSPKNVEVTPGSTIYVPLSVDRINGREFTESWVDLIYKLSISAASIDFLFGK